MPNCKICLGELENSSRNRTFKKYNLNEQKSCECEIHENCWKKLETRFKRKPFNKFVCREHTCMFCRTNSTNDVLQCNCAIHSDCYQKIKDNILLSSSEDYEVKATSSDLEVHRMPYCYIHDCGICRAAFRTDDPKIQLSCGCIMHSDCAYQNQPILSTQCPLCLYELSNEDLEEYNKLSGLLSYVYMNWPGSNRTKLFNKEFIQKRSERELIEIGITVDDILVAGFTFQELTRQFSPKVLGEMSLNCTHITPDVYQWLLERDDAVKDLKDMKLTFPVLKTKFTYLQLKKLGFTAKDLVEQEFTKADFFKSKIIPMSEFKQYFALDKTFLINHLKLNPLDYKRIFSSSSWTRQQLIDIFKFNTQDLKTVDLPESQTESVTSIFESWTFASSKKEEKKEKAMVVNEIDLLRVGFNAK